MLLVKHGRFCSMQVPEPGNTLSQSSVPVPGRHDRKRCSLHRPSIGPPWQTLLVQTPSVQELLMIWPGQKHEPGGANGDAQLMLESTLIVPVVSGSMSI